MTDYSFLQTIRIVDNSNFRQPTSKNPVGFTVRLMADGSVYPSKELVERFNLRYKNKNQEDQGNGIDVLDSLTWSPMKDFPRMLLFGVSSKTNAKLDLFSSTKYDKETNEPKGDVLTQGSKSEELLTLVNNFNWFPLDGKYLDLKVMVDNGFTPENGIANLPKKVAKGPNAGQDTYERRENITFYPVEMVQPESVLINTEELSEVN